MNYNELCAIVRRVDYLDFIFNVGITGFGFYVQIGYDEVDVDTGKMAPQRGRKWYVSAHATPSEVVQTMLKAAITSAEHRVREHFLVDGARAFGPHIDVDELVTIANRRSKRS